MQVPEAVIKEAGELIKRFGKHFEHLGKYEGQDVFLFLFPDGSNTGFPFVYLYKDGSAISVTGFEALDITAQFDN